ncbi:MAG: hypothetical protein HY747_00780 [Elusimicrobia bacterium]|nr:hypothetical protein [Elusimicrobiota bacterium]
MPKNKSTPSSRIPLSIEDLKKILFTKDDARESEVKLNMRLGSIERQLSSMATKQYLENLATATKQDLENLAAKADLSRVETKIDHLDKVITQVTFKEVIPKMEDHEKRLNKLEAAAT